jgi:hypothetical protein
VRRVIQVPFLAAVGIVVVAFLWGYRGERLLSGFSASKTPHIEPAVPPPPTNIPSRPIAEKGPPEQKHSDLPHSDQKPATAPSSPSQLVRPQIGSEPIVDEDVDEPEEDVASELDQIEEVEGGGETIEEELEDEEVLDDEPAAEDAEAEDPK